MQVRPGALAIRRASSSRTAPLSGAIDSRAAPVRVRTVALARRRYYSGVKITRGSEQEGSSLAEMPESVRARRGWTRGSEQGGSPVTVPDRWLPSVLVSGPARRGGTWRRRSEDAAPRGGSISADAVRSCATLKC